MRRFRWLWCGLAVVFALGNVPVRAGFTVDFEDLSLPGESFNNGSDGAGGFTSRGAEFNNSFTDFGGGFTVWQGWSYSNVTNVTNPGFENQYSAYHLPGGGGDGSPTYGVAYNFNPGDATILLPKGARPTSLSLTNTTYTALSMLNGDGFAKKFGGASGLDPDYLRLSISGLDDSGTVLGLVEFFLADYRFANSALDYVVENWTEVDLTSLGDARKLSFALESTDVDPIFGSNTPMYFAMDNLRLAAVPEPGQAAIWLLTAATAAYLFRRRAADTRTVIKLDHRCH